MANKSEELDINSGTPVAKATAVENEAAEHVNDMSAKNVDVSSMFKPGATNEEIVNQIIAAPETTLNPFEECWLPSKGLYYNWPDGMVKVKPMGQTAEKVLATQRLAQSGQSIDELFRNNCQFPDGFDPLDLLLGDRVFLLYYLRGITHGNLYDFAFTCPNAECNHISTYTYDFNDLASTITYADPSLGREPFKVILPHMSKITGREFWVGVRFLRAADANDMLAKRRSKRKMFAKPGGVRTGSNKVMPGRAAMDPRRQAADNQSLDDTISDNLGKIIVSVLGVNDVFTVRNFITKLHAMDTAAIREWLKEHTPGIDNTITISCSECGTESTAELPITEGFFRPAKSAGV